VLHDFINVDQGIHDTTTRLAGQNEAWKASMRRLSGGLSDGVDVVTLDNGRLSLEILPTRGMGIWRGIIDGIPVKWDSPVERPVHPTYVDQMRRGGIGWLDGFNELICRCGLGWHGAPGNDIIRDIDGKIVSEQFLPLHGRIANLAAHHVSVEERGDVVAVTGIVDEASLFGGRLRLESTLTTRIHSNAFEITDVVSNLGGQSAEVEMLYHCNIGRPFLGEGSEFHTAASEVAPRNNRAAEGINMWNLFDGPTKGYAEQVYFTKAAADSAGRSMAVLADAESRHAVCVRFGTKTMPYFVLWKNTQAEADGYVAGLEPGSSFPNLRTVERREGRVIQLATGESVTFSLSMEVASNRRDVRRLLDEVTELQVAHPQIVHPSPKAEWV
jgi:galactose mutarotase-like enzyme